MSRRGWKDQRAALFEDADVAFGAERAVEGAPERAEPEIVDPEPGADLWSEEPPPVAPLRRKRARRAWFTRDRSPNRSEAPAPRVETLFATPAAARSEARARRRWLAPREEALPKDLVGRDLAGGPPRRARVRRRLPLALLAGGIVAALLLVTLRVEILRLRYAAAEVAAEEQDLSERIAQARFRLRELRDPARLRKLAAARGFVRPERVLQVELPRRAPDVAAAPAPEARP